MTSTDLGDRAVACACDARFHWPVLVEGTGANSRVTACLSCGTVTYALAGVDEPRAGDIRFHGYYTGSLPATVMDWLAQWPRVRVTWHSSRWPMSSDLVRRDRLYLPATTRCGDLSGLDRTVAQAEERQAGQRNGQRLIEAGGPSDPPPVDLAAEFRWYREIWEALQLRPTSPVQQLMPAAQLNNGGSAVAVEWLLQRADISTLLEQALTGTDPVWWSAGYAIARDQRPVDPALPGLLIQLLRNVSPFSDPQVPGRIAGAGRCEALLALIADLGLREPKLLAELEALRKRVWKRDWTLVKYIGMVTRELA